MTKLMPIEERIQYTLYQIIERWRNDAAIDSGESSGQDQASGGEQGPNVFSDRLLNYHLQPSMIQEFTLQFNYRLNASLRELLELALNNNPAAKQKIIALFRGQQFSKGMAHDMVSSLALAAELGNYQAEEILESVFTVVPQREYSGYKKLLKSICQDEALVNRIDRSLEQEQSYTSKMTPFSMTPKPRGG